MQDAPPLSQVVGLLAHPDGALLLVIPGRPVATASDELTAFHIHVVDVSPSVDAQHLQGPEILRTGLAGGNPEKDSLTVLRFDDNTGIDVFVSGRNSLPSR